MIRDYQLNAYDIIHKARYEISKVAELCGIDWQATEPRLNDSRGGFKCVPIEKKYKGSVKAWLQIKTAKSGQQYPVINFHTPKNGGITESFNGWQYGKDNGLFGNQESHTRRSAPTPKPPAQKTAPATTPAQASFKPLKVCKTCGQKFTPAKAWAIECFDCYSYPGKLKRYRETKELFNSLPPVETITGYLERKGVSIDDIKTGGLDIRQGNGFVIYPLFQAEKLTGFQFIYDSKVLDDGERDKDYCFYPIKTTGTTYKQGSYAVIGDLDNAGNGLFFCEGLVTGLTVFLATGLTVIVCLDAGGLDAGMANFSGYTKKYIAADNDLKAGDSGNVGIYSALKAAKKHKARVFVPVDTDSAGNFIKCDYNDLMQAKGIEAVTAQLKLRNNDNEVKPSEETLFKYCPEKQLESLALKFCYQAAKRISTKAQFRVETKRYQIMFDNRGFTEFKARKVIFNALRGIIETVQKDNCFSGHPLVTRIDIAGLSNQAIAAKVATLNGLVIDNRGMAAGKTELMRLITEIIKAENTPPAKAKTKQISDTERKAYFLSTGLNANDWQTMRANNESFAIWQRLNDGKVKAWLKAEPATPQAKRRKIAAISHRTSLIDSLSNRLGLPHYEKVKSFDPDNVAVCLPSIHKFESLEPTDIFFDEWRQMLEFLHNSGGCIANPLAVEKQLIEWINGAGLIIAADADFNQASLEWILNNCPSIPVYWLDSGKQSGNGKTIQLLEGKDSIDKLITRALETLSSGGRVWLAFDSETQARRAYENILKAQPAITNLVLTVTGENKGDINEALFLANPNEESKKFQAVIHSPVISSGVSITENFDFVGAGFYGVIAPNEQLQTIARVRTAKTITVALCNEIETDRLTNQQAFIEGETVKRGRYCVNKGVLTLTSFDRFRNKQRAATNHALNNSRQHFKILAQLKSYTVQNAEPTALEKLATATGQQIKAAISTTDVKQFKVAEIKTAAPLNDNEAGVIDKKTARTQAETNSLKKYQARTMAAKFDYEITEDDIFFAEYDSGLSKTLNAELVNYPDLEELKEYDNDHHDTRGKQSSRTSKAFLFSYVVNALNGQPVKRALIQFCLDFLHQNSKEVASNGLGNFSYPTSDTRKLNAFLDKAGYSLVETEQETTGKRERIYTLQLNPLIAEYLANRARRKAEELEPTTG